MIADVGGLHQFLRSAACGDVAVYHVGLLTYDRSSFGPLNKGQRNRLDALANAVLKAAGYVKSHRNSNKGEEQKFYQTQPALVTLVQQRIGPRVCEYLMQRTAMPYKSETLVQSKESVQ